MAAWVKQYDLDGIDVDYEDLNAFDAGDGKAGAWLISFTKQLRIQLPQEDTYLITHAPVAPWFSPPKWRGGGYLKIHSSVGSLIDWYNIQFYNLKSSAVNIFSRILIPESNKCRGGIRVYHMYRPSCHVFHMASDSCSANC
ncbi:hypothetical protein CPB84DRAFT_1027112 [Gymnopilus junonius]|uniref:GH18 domain-containing protein n=1 Tax=Gymnopilus junonius TaxID=109634 RepID=A0A9P5TF42_GYMJU|nr:hypothetical protein CPB84DRAFT_1027112 [Gymnopilus junonius]